MKTRLLLLITLSIFSQTLFSQCPALGYTCIPDSNFEQALINQMIDSEGTLDGRVLTADVNTIVNLGVSNLGIVSLEGIEDFTSLEILDCSQNSIGNLDLSTNMNLTQVFCHYNGMTSLILPPTNTLVRLDCYNNSLTALGILNNTNLEILFCYNNFIGNTFNLSGHTALINFACNNNDIDELILPSTGTMTRLWCSFNNLTSLDVTGLPNLEKLNFTQNSIPSIDLSMNTKLDELFCTLSGLTGTLDLTANTMLTRIDCDRNSITDLQLPTTSTLSQLRCWSNELTSLVTTGLTGLTYLNCGSNDIVSLDLTDSMSLNYLDVYYSYLLTSLTLPPTNTLETLWAYSTDLSNLDFTSNTGLVTMDIANGNFTSLDVSMLNNLQYFYCNENDLLTSLNVKNSNNDNMPTMWAQDNLVLECIEVDNPALAATYPDWLRDEGTDYMVTCPSLGIEKFDLTSVSIYPNPSKDKFYIDLQFEANYSLTNLFGQDIRKGTLLLGINELDISSLSNGLYLLNIDTPEGKVTKKVIRN